MRYIICKNQTEFDAINEQIHSGLKRDVKGYNAKRWANPIVHPTDGRIALVVETRVEKYLTTDEAERIVELSEDWFPNIEEN